MDCITLIASVIGAIAAVAAAVASIGSWAHAVQKSFDQSAPEIEVRLLPSPRDRPQVLAGKYCAEVSVVRPAETRFKISMAIPGALLANVANGRDPKDGEFQDRSIEVVNGFPTLGVKRQVWVRPKGEGFLSRPRQAVLYYELSGPRSIRRKLWLRREKL